MSDMMSRTHFEPVTGMGTIIEEGIIWHMEFLYTHTDSTDRILLALIVYNDIDRICRMVVFAIDVSDPLNVTTERIGRLPLDRNTPLPVLLIPLVCLPETFILVTEQHVCVLTADDIACGNVMYPSSPLPRKPNETFYGRIYNLDISLLEDIKWTLVAQVNPIGQAMCVISPMTMTQKDGTEISVDVMVYGGEGADSQVIAINHIETDSRVSCDMSCQDNFVVIQEFTNRAPLMDYQIVHDKIVQQDKLITCAGQGQNGVINVISQGYQAINVAEPSSGWGR
ncbi:mono-functional DNA-alkylating methyl methanesulfonate N-term-domain-containing protein [Phycomyces nitens]|nr:mono-functional DNA-alkylating methyl methanesulfonate N-term-domain-containing protein [Phycomyces nitens]